MLKTKEIGDNIVVYLKGRLDVHLSTEIEKEINEIINNNPDANLVINLDDVEYMSSSGLRVLVASMRVLKSKDKTLKLCHLNPAVKKVFEVVELMDMFDIYNTEAEAVEALN